jgi:hypothetical protein
MATTTTASLILTNLGMFNESVIFFNAKVEPKFLEAIDNAVEQFVEANVWVGKFELNGDSNCWLAPEKWNMAAPGEDSDPKAWFGIECINGDDDYWTALFCGVGSQSGEAGFMFDVLPREFGGRNAWRNNIPPTVVDGLKELGFIQKGGGKFFLPIRLDLTKLATAFEEDEPDFEDVLEPLKDALNKLVEASVLLDPLVSPTLPVQGRPKKNDDLNKPASASVLLDPLVSKK